MESQESLHSGLVREDSSYESLNIDWTSSEDEHEVETASTMHLNHTFDPGLSCSSSTLSSSKAIDEFLSMGFSVELVKKVLKELGSSDEEAVLDALLRYSSIENSPDSEDDFNVDVQSDDDEKGSNFSVDSFSDEDQDYVYKEIPDSIVEKDNIVSVLVEMGYQADCASAAIDICGMKTPLAVLIDMMDAAAMANDDDIFSGESFGEKYDTKKRCFPSDTRRKLHVAGQSKSKRRKVFSRNGRSREKQPMIHDDDDDERFCLPNPMIGFGVPSFPLLIRTDRKIPGEATGRPYFYFENVANTPKGAWQTMSRFLYGIRPEYVDSKYFSAACRKRGYIHNLPINNRFQVFPACPKTIHEAVPQTKEHWPSWDTRTQFNCILTCTATATMTDEISVAVDKHGGPSAEDRDSLLKRMKRWNLIWVGKNKVAPLEPDEIEKIMGFRVSHTRGGGVTRTDRYRLLGNTFQVDTVAYHLSTLKNMFPGGMNVLSLFSGIGGAEVALHRLGIRLNNVVSIEKSEACRKVLQDWWIQTNQQGNLIHFHDVELVTHQHLQTWVSDLGGFDLIIGGSPCDNLAGVNRATRTGLEGAKSVLFYDFYRIVHGVRSLMKS